MMRPIRSVLACLAAAIAVSACHSPLQIAAANRPIREAKSLGTRVEGESCQWFLLGVLPVSGGNTVRAAVDAAKRKAGAETLVELTVDERSLWLALIGNHCTLVSGVPVHG